VVPFFGILSQRALRSWTIEDFLQCLLLQESRWIALFIDSELGYICCNSGP